MKLYDAEHIVQRIFDHSAQGAQITIYDVPLVLPREQKFSSIEQIQEYVDQILALSDIRDIYAPDPIRVRVRKGISAAHYESEQSVIAIPENTWALREIVVLHEISHHLYRMRMRYKTDKNGNNSHKAHGQEFMEIYVDLCERILGEQAAFLMRMVFIDAGIWGRKSR